MRTFKLEPYYYEQTKKEYCRTTNTLYVPESRIHTISFNTIRPGFCQITLVEEISYPLVIEEKRGLEIIQIMET
jgi:hypothetical protein